MCPILYFIHHTIETSLFILDSYCPFSYLSVNSAGEKCPAVQGDIPWKDSGGKGNLTDETLCQQPSNGHLGSYTEERQR
jgi:hypothetical protein